MEKTIKEGKDLSDWRIDIDSELFDIIALIEVTEEYADTWSQSPISSPEVQDAFCNIGRSLRIALGKVKVAINGMESIESLWLEAKKEKIEKALLKEV